MISLLGFAERRSLVWRVTSYAILDEIESKSLLKLGYCTPWSNFNWRVPPERSV
jgi:hypothetical protein